MAKLYRSQNRKEDTERREKWARHDGSGAIETGNGLTLIWKLKWFKIWRAAVKARGIVLIEVMRISIKNSIKFYQQKMKFSATIQSRVVANMQINFRCLVRVPAQIVPKSFPLIGIEIQSPDLMEIELNWISPPKDTNIEFR